MYTQYILCTQFYEYKIDINLFIIEKHISTTANTKKRKQKSNYGHIVDGRDCGQIWCGKKCHIKEYFSGGGNNTWITSYYHFLKYFCCESK